MDDYRPVVEGDVLAIRGSSRLADGIVAATGGPCSHVGLFISVAPPVVIEALSRVKTDPLDVSLQHARQAWILHDKSLTKEQRRAIIYAATNMSAYNYGWLALPAQGLDALLHTTWPTDHLGWLLSRYPICSYLVARAYATVELTFGKKMAESITPADIFSFAKSNPAIFDIQEIVI